MTYEEAIKNINALNAVCCQKDFYDTEFENALALAIKALEKQIPKKPIIREAEDSFGFVKYILCTNCEKAMYAELKKNPYVDLCASKLQEDEITTAWIRFSAEVVFPDESEEILKIKEAIMKKSAIVKELYNDNPKNLIFKVFYLKNIQGSLSNLGHVKGLEERENFLPVVEFKF